MGLQVKADIPAATDLLGLSVTDLQSNIEVGASAIGGTLKYVEGYTGFSGDPAEQSGNYIALHATAVDGATITCEVVGGLHGEATLDEDGIIICRLASNATPIRFKATKSGKTETQTFNLQALVLEEPEE